MRPHHPNCCYVLYHGNFFKHFKIHLVPWRSSHPLTSTMSILPPPHEYHVDPPTPSRVPWRTSHPLTSTMSIFPHPHEYHGEPPTLSRVQWRTSHPLTSTMAIIPHPHEYHVDPPTPSRVPWRSSHTLTFACHYDVHTPIPAPYAAVSPHHSIATPTETP